MGQDCTLADVDPRTLHEIMGEGATRPETPQDRREREQIEADLESSPVRGKPLRQRLRNFKPDPESGVRSLGGPTAWMRRLRAIEGRDEHGAEVRYELEEPYSRVAQHEADHLDGVLILDRTTPEARREALGSLRPRIVIG